MEFQSFKMIFKIFWWNFLVKKLNIKLKYAKKSTKTDDNKNFKIISLYKNLNNNIETTLK